MKYETSCSYDAISEFNSDLVEIMHKPFIEIQSLEFDTQVLHHKYDWIIFF